MECDIKYSQMEGGSAMDRGDLECLFQIQSK